MSKSPGHQRWPEHHVDETHLNERVIVRVNGEVIAESSDVIRVDEDEHPARYYFPRSDVKARLQRSATHTECPFKGPASYFDLEVEGEQLHDAVWSYEKPYDEHADLKERVAFADDQLPQIEVRPA